MEWRDNLFDLHDPATRDGTVAWAGRHSIGFVGLMGVGEDDPDHGKWVWQLVEVTAAHATLGHVATKARAKAALTRAWARWLDERGLVARPAQDASVREALAEMEHLLGMPAHKVITHPTMRRVLGIEEG